MLFTAAGLKLLETQWSKGLGVIATRSFVKFTVLFEEMPVMIGANYEISLSKLELEFSRLPEHIKRQIMLLAGPAHIMGKMRTNSMPLGFDAAAGGLFIRCARFNHSCTPNARYIWNEAIGREQIFALRDINIGEEVTVCYTDVLQSKSSRIATLMSKFGFECQCPTCMIPNEGEEQWRQKASVLDDQILHHISHSDYAKGEELANRRLAVLAERPWTSYDMLRTIYDACQACRNAGWKAKAQQWARRCVEANSRCYGVEHPITKERKAKVAQF